MEYRSHLFYILLGIPTSAGTRAGRSPTFQDPGIPLSGLASTWVPTNLIQQILRDRLKSSTSPAKGISGHLSPPPPAPLCNDFPFAGDVELLGRSISFQVLNWVDSDSWAQVGPTIISSNREVHHLQVIHNCASNTVHGSWTCQQLWKKNPSRSKDLEVNDIKYTWLPLRILTENAFSCEPLLSDLI